MNREPVNPDDPQMTAYALGELSVAEAAEFEIRLQDSPRARRELSEMRAVMALLGEGLRGEWKSGFEAPALKLLEPVAAPNEAVVVEVNFRPLRGRFAAAAAVAAMLLVGAAALSGRKGSESEVATVVAMSESAIPAIVPHIPQLILAEEVGDLSSLDLVDGATVSGPAIDATYLEADAMIPASFQPGQSGSRTYSQERGASLERIDSYLPPLGGTPSGRGATGMIERRLGRDGNEGASTSESVLVSGYVTMGGGEEAPRFLGGFRPVSISGNPVVNEESDLRLLADLNGLQKELSEVIGEMPMESGERASLERILERSKRVASQLKGEIAR